MFGLTAPKHYYNQTPRYERNYTKLMRIAQRLPAHRYTQRIETGGIAFTLRLIEDHRYTTIIELTVTLAHSHDALLNPTMQVRMYHDARVAEVASFNGHSRFEPEYDYPNKHMFHRDEKRQINQLLSEWLDLLERAPDDVREPVQDVL